MAPAAEIPEAPAGVLKLEEWVSSFEYCEEEGWGEVFPREVTIDQNNVKYFSLIIQVNFFFWSIKGKCCSLIQYLG